APGHEVQDGAEHAVLRGGHQHAVAVPRTADAAERHGEAAFSGTAPPGVRDLDDAVKLRARDVSYPPDLGDVPGLGDPVYHLPDVAHRTPRQAEIRDVHDRLVAELESGQVAFPAPHLGTEFAAPHDSGAPGVPCRHGEELGDGARPRLRVADRVAGREPHSGPDAVAAARLAGR